MARPRAPSPRSADLVAVLALLLALPGLWIAPRMFFASWLAAWWFWIGITLGALANCWIHALTGGRWGEALRLLALPLGRRLPWLLLPLLPLAAAPALAWPWASEPAAAWTRGIDLPAFQLAWYAPPFFRIRLAVLALAWWAISGPWVFARKGRVAAAAIVHVVAGSIAALDLVASLVPGWISTGNGLVQLAGGALGGAALATWAAAAFAPSSFPPPPPRPAVKPPPPVWRDLGNLLLMWVMTWAYLAFVEFLVIWSEDLPREVAWYLPRLAGGWAGIGIALALLQFALPLLALLVRANKDAPRRLARLAAALLAGQLLNTAWLVLPSVEPRGWLGWWLLPLLALAMGLPLVARALGELRDAPAARPSPQVRHA
jgi:hypothetical protein